MDNTLDLLLADPDRYVLQWFEERQGVNRDGDRSFVATVVSVNIEDALALVRLVSWPDGNRMAESDRELLSIFLDRFHATHVDCRPWENAPEVAP
jgi:hypothetical protein